MEKYVLRIIEKVRSMYKYDTLLKDIVKQDAIIEFEEYRGKLNLVSISFNYYDRLYVCSSGIIFYPEIGTKRQILEYDGFSKLLEM